MNDRLADLIEEYKISISYIDRGKKVFPIWLARSDSATSGVELALGHTVRHAVESLVIILRKR